MTSNQNKVIQEFLEKCLFLDTESTGLDPKVAEICELGISISKGNEFSQDSMLFGTEEPIPFAASAKNNISRKMIAGLPTFAESTKEIDKFLNLNEFDFIVGHNVKYDKIIIESNVAKLSPKLKFAPGKKWLCTYRLAKKLFPKTEDTKEDIGHSLSFLRYYLDLDVPDDMGVHRAGADAFVCAKLFEYMCIEIYNVLGLKDNRDITAETFGELVYAYCTDPIEYDVLPFGKKYPGKKITSIARDDPRYLIWCLENMDTFNPDNFNYDEDLDLSIRRALEEVC